MSVQVTVIGTGSLGTSVGLALATQAHQLTRVAHDPSADAARKAHKMGAFDQVQLNLHQAVEQADIVVLALPVDEIRPTLEQIAPDLQPGALVVDLSPAKTAVTRWAQELLPEEVHFVAFVPSLNPAYLLELPSQPEDAHADLFQNSLIFITTPPGTSPEGLELATNLALLLGARPFFADVYESDGLLAAVHLLPRLTAAALLNATANRPGWQEARKLAGPAYAQITAQAEQLDESEQFGQAALLNKDNVLRVLDNLSLALDDLRQAIARDDAEALAALLGQARQARQAWWDERHIARWDLPEKPAEMPAKGEVFTRLFGLGGRKKKENKS
ncbi:MAG: prephenate dehydrogenase [Chloroflexi bacterium]|nr:prephenate dehydrogenase [Anaerolineaceae bacterium]NMB88106.1 prephenate dehydrogenase [Chloroflexota bacterium]